VLRLRKTIWSFEHFSWLRCATAKDGHPPVSRFPKTHNLPVTPSPYDAWHDLVSIMVGAVAAVGAMVIGTLA